MGWSSSWIAIQGCEKDELLKYLNLEETGEKAFPGDGSVPFCVSELPGKWMVVFSEDFDWASPSRVLEMSKLGLTLGCQFEDRVAMTSAVCAARAGVELWRVFHNSEQSIYRLDVTGNPPEELAAIRDQLFQEQEHGGGEDSDADYVHDVPLELAKAVCGYRHDDYEPPFTALKRTGSIETAAATSKSGFLAKLMSVFVR